MRGNTCPYHTFNIILSNATTYFAKTYDIFYIHNQAESKFPITA